MARKLVTDTRVQNPDTGEQVILKPGDEIPGWAEKLITNPAAWEQEELAPDPDAQVLPEPEPAVARTEEEQDAEQTPEQDADAEQTPEQTDPSAYEAMTVAELKAEIAFRNEGRTDADRLSTDGVKADLVAALVADDEA